MSPLDFVIIGVVLVAVTIGIVRAVGMATGKRDCCSGSKNSCSCHHK